MKKRIIIGLDIHKRETQACVMNEKGTIIEETRFPTRERAYNAALKKYASAETVIEATGMYRPVARWLTKLGHDVHLANVNEIPKKKVKTDKKDARHLGHLHRTDLLPEAFLPPEETQRLRDIARQRHFLGQESRRLKAKIKLDLLKHGHFLDANPVETKAGRAWLATPTMPEIGSCLLLLNLVEQEKTRFEKQIASETTILPEAQLLTTIPGVGAYTALLVLAEVGDFHRFDHKDALASLAGLGLKEEQSGDTQKTGSITRQGKPLLRWALVEAARRNHLRNCPHSTLSIRHRRIAKKRGNNKAMIATARVLITIMYVMIIKNEAFQVNPSKPASVQAS